MYNVIHISDGVKDFVNSLPTKRNIRPFVSGDEVGGESTPSVWMVEYFEDITMYTIVQQSERKTTKHCNPTI
jgi:hypothetical protein